VFILRLLYILLILLVNSNVVAKEINEQDIIIGDINAKNTIIKYSSLTCPHCASFFLKNLPKLEDKYFNNGKVKFIFRPFVLNQTDLYASAILKCIDQEKVLTMIKVLYMQHKNNWHTSKNYKEILNNIVKIGGLWTPDMQECLDSKDIYETLIEERQFAVKKWGINSTPSIVINNKRIKNIHLNNIKNNLDKLVD